MNTISIDESCARLRLSLALVLARAVKEMFNGTRLGGVAVTAEGFHCDFELPVALTESHLPLLEDRMRGLLRSGGEIVCVHMTRGEALERFERLSEPYLVELQTSRIPRHPAEVFEFHEYGPCLLSSVGSLVNRCGLLPLDGFRLQSVAGAYWQGDRARPMLTRVCAVAFADAKTLSSHLQEQERASARDHRKLGRELDLFAFDPAIGKGLPIWLPKGTVIRDELEKLARELEFKAGYERVVTPHIARESLYTASGHLPYYREHMYPPMHLLDERDEAEHGSAQGAVPVRQSYVLRPMNCPHHHRVFAARPRSYRELPLRLAEYGQVYRMEDSGALSGLLRVRGMCMNDAHIYCTPEQVEAELTAVLALYREAYATVGLESYRVRLSRWDPEHPRLKHKYVDDPEAWASAEASLQKVLDTLGFSYSEERGEAAFYGPKIDIQLPTVGGREETVSTVQLDFVQPRRLGLSYVAADGQARVPLCIHRAPFSTHERFVAYLIEHYAGAFPTWLAPVQVRVLTVSRQFDGYAGELVESLREAFVRAERAPSEDTLARKVRNAHQAKVPNVLIVGAREASARTVTLKQYGVDGQLTLTFSEFRRRLIAGISRRQPRIFA